MEEVREWWARTSPAMQQMRGILHQGGGQRVLGGYREHAPLPIFPPSFHGLAEAFGGILAPVFRQFS